MLCEEIVSKDREMQTATNGRTLNSKTDFISIASLKGFPKVICATDFNQRSAMIFSAISQRRNSPSVAHLSLVVIRYSLPFWGSAGASPSKFVHRLKSVATKTKPAKAG